jgi:TPR repeat protein
MGVSILHIKSEIECRVFLFDEEKGIAKPNVYFNLEVGEGEQEIKLIHTAYDTIFYQMHYKGEKNGLEYWIKIKPPKYNKQIADILEEFKLAKKRNAEARFRLGERYYYGDGLIQNRKSAFKWYRKAAWQGYADAQYCLGKCYYYGEGAKENREKAAKWYRKAAKKGIADSQYCLGNCFMNGQGVIQKSEEAVKWYLKAAEQGHAYAQYNLGECYEKGNIVVQNWVEAIKWYRKAAEQGHACAQYKLGKCYEGGTGVVQKQAEAEKWYHKAAEQGNTDAQYCLGMCYVYRQNWIETAKWFHMAAEQGHAIAQFWLGGCYEFGRGVEQNLKEAVAWYIKASEQGNADAQFKLGDCSEKGNGVEQDWNEAIKWYSRAAEQEQTDAQYKLGDCYENGNGVKQDWKEAVKWYRKAAEKGHADAQYNLGKCYESRIGVEKNYEEAVKWFNKAAEQGHADAQYQLGVYYSSSYYGMNCHQVKATMWFRKAVQSYLAEEQYMNNIDIKNDLSTENGNYVSALKILAYRYLDGIGVQENCNMAKNYLHAAINRGLRIPNRDQVSLSSRLNKKSFNKTSYYPKKMVFIQEMIDKAKKRMKPLGLSHWNAAASSIIDNGREVIQNDIQADYYLAAYGELHIKRLGQLFGRYSYMIKLNENDFEIFDYGCGQGLATMGLIDVFPEEHLQHLKRITLIDNSPFILRRAEVFLRQILNKHGLDTKCTIRTIETSLPTAQDIFVHPSVEYPTIVHLFSNILDIDWIDLKKMADSIIHTGDCSIHYVLATHPGTSNYDSTGNRMFEFFSLLPDSNGKVDDSDQGIRNDGKEWCNLYGFARWDAKNKTY